MYNFFLFFFFKVGLMKGPRTRIQKSDVLPVSLVEPQLK